MSIEKPKVSAFDLRPHLEFVEEHKDKFKAAINDLLKRSTQHEFTASIQVDPKDKYPQYQESLITNLLASMPESLLAFSDLKQVLFEEHVVEPVFSEDGVWETVKHVSPESYPDDQYQVLVGNTWFYEEGEFFVISQSVIPEHFTDDPEAIWIYQTHVFLHEFFHTIEQNKRSEEQRSSMQFAYQGQTFNFQNWYEDFEKLIISGDETQSVSYYASVYKDKLNQDCKKQDPKVYTRALMEQICETFVAYQLNIISNPNGWTNFQEAAPKKWALMNKLCQAEPIINI